MATLAFAALGSAIGGSIGGSFLGISAAVIGQGVGASIGRAVDQRLIGGLSPTRTEGPRLDNLDVMTSREGNALPQIAGRAAISGEVIWATKLRESSQTDTRSVGSGKKKQKVRETTYRYSASFALSLGEGPMRHFGRVWANGHPLDLTDMIEEGRVRFYPGSDTQMPDPLIDGIEGGAPAYRGTAYLVFEDLPLEEWGNAVPQIKVEVWGQSGEMEDLLRGVNIIPGSTEWGYMPTPVQEVLGADSKVPLNAARHASVADWKLSMDQLGALMPAVDTASLVVAWFGTDLRAGQCEIEPRTELKAKVTEPAWRAGGLTRAEAKETSRTPQGRPAYGSSPADLSVIRSIRDLRARGQRTVLYPFIMMDVTDAQALPDPSGTGVQGAYPWRGRIIPTASEDAQAEVDAFMGTASAANFGVNGESVTYSGPPEWRFRRFILHLASLAKAAGGVDAFLIGTEMRGLSMTPSAPGVYPFVGALKSLAAEVRAILPDAKISYAADWSEYHSHQDGGDLRFHLDPLWADPNIDFVGIDNYLPLSDWRAGRTHADFDDAKGHTTTYSLDYLKGNIEGGEYWDWFYASEADRAAQVRTPITDGAYGEPWVFRQKAIRDWHANAHHERTGGTRAAAATDWTPGSKPVWFTELGCPAVDFGANRPNVFSAANSSEGTLPWFSAGVRDDYMQRQFLRASLEWWRDNGGTAVDVGDVQVWCWDARPWPEYPLHASVWADGPDWFLGHWLNGRAGAAPAAEALARRLTAHGLTAADFDLTACHGQADGYPAASPIGFRDFMQPLEVGLGLQAHERDGKLLVETRVAAPAVFEVGVDAMVDTASGAPFVAKRGALEDVTGAAVMRFSDGLGEYEQVSTRAVIGAGHEAGVSTVDSPLVLDFDRGSAASERLLRAAADGRETVTFRLPRSAVRVRPGVILPVRLSRDLPARPMMIERVVDGEDRQLEARSFNAGAFAPTGGVFRPAPAIAVRGSTQVTARFLDLPILPGSTAEDWDTLVALSGDPWPGGSIAKSTTGANFGEVDPIPLRSITGVTLTDLARGTPSVWQGGTVDVELASGVLVTLTDAEVLAGANGLAVQHPGGWEVLQFTSADLIGARRYRLSRMLRGRGGTEHLMDPSGLPAGATIVLLDATLTPLGVEGGEIGLPRFYRTGSARTDVSTHVVREHVAQAVGRRPFSPVHLRVARDGGDLSVTWIRRSRAATDADWTEADVDVPLGEGSERYAVEVVKDGDVKRAATATAPDYAYGSSAQAEDGVTAPFTIRVAQVSETYGPGAWASVQIS